MTTTTKQTVLSAINSTLPQTAFDTYTAKVTEAAAKTVGKTFATQFTDDERIGLVAHVYVEDRLGAMNSGFVGVTDG